MTKTTLEREIELRLFEKEVRYTKGRRAVVAALAAASGPMSAAELADVVDVPLSSLYRTLSVLEESGVVDHHLGAKGLTRYELAEWLAGHHHHLVCVGCGSVEDIEIPALQEESVRELVRQIAALASFHPSDHALEIEGTCVKCA
ncbi:MAG TPA: transcriptional repressor [Acidimicrobiia bacterium]|nr:transcriptional repressor [Acidimicrobiia bacterium]